ncbi:unnamed protein product [Absidia cylindrospora]
MMDHSTNMMTQQQQQQCVSNQYSDSDSGSHNGEQQQLVYAQATSSTAQQGPINYPYGYHPPNLNGYYFLPYQYLQKGPFAMYYPPAYHYPVAMPDQQPFPVPTAPMNEPPHPDSSNNIRNEVKSQPTTLLSQLCSAALKGPAL